MKSGVKKVQPQLTKAKEFVQEKTPKEAKEYATRAFLFLTAAREELVKVLAAKLLMVYQNVDFFCAVRDEIERDVFLVRFGPNVDVLLGVPNGVASAFRTQKSERGQQQQKTSLRKRRKRCRKR